MGTTSRALSRAAWLASRTLNDLGSEFRERRLSMGVSQAHVAAACGISRPYYGRIEMGMARSLAIAEAHRIAAVLGLAASVRVYPDGVAVRDVAHSKRLQAFLGLARPPLSYRIEVPLPVAEGRSERRAWDAVLFDGSARCAVELEMRLRDVQAARRKVDLKRRDDPTERFVLLVADTRFNRRILAEFEALLVELPRLRPSRVQADLRAGRLPPTGTVLV